MGVRMNSSKSAKTFPGRGKNILSEKNLVSTLGHLLKYFVLTKKIKGPLLLTLFLKFPYRGSSHSLPHCPDGHDLKIVWIFKIE